MIVPITDEQLKEIQAIFPRSQAEIDQDLAIIKHWQNKQHHLPKTSDEMLKKLMFSLKYRKDKVKYVIENHYTIKEAFPEIYANLDPTTDTFRLHVDKTYMFPLPKLTPELNRVLCYQVTSTDPKTICSDSLLKRNEMICSWQFDKDPLTAGIVWIFDLIHMDSLAHWANFNLSFIKKVLKVNQDAKPTRLRRVHFVNVSPIAETTLNFLKMGIPQKIRNRILFSSNTDSLHEFYPVDMLPNEWGGKAGTLSELNQKMYEELIKRRSWFLEMEKMKADESKRIGQSKTSDPSLLGVEGSFKTLNFD